MRVINDADIRLMRLGKKIAKENKPETREVLNEQRKQDFNWFKPKKLNT